MIEELNKIAKLQQQLARQAYREMWDEKGENFGNENLKELAI